MAETLTSIRAHNEMLQREKKEAQVLGVLATTFVFLLGLDFTGFEAAQIACIFNAFLLFGQSVQYFRLSFANEQERTALLEELQKLGFTGGWFHFLPYVASTGVAGTRDEVLNAVLEESEILTREAAQAAEARLGIGAGGEEDEVSNYGSTHVGSRANR